MFCAGCDTVEIRARRWRAPQQPQTLLEELLSDPEQISLRSSKAETPLHIIYEEAAEFLRNRRSEDYRSPPLTHSQRYNQSMSTLEAYTRHVLDERICDQKHAIISEILSTPRLADTKLSSLCDVLVKRSAQTVNMFATFYLQKIPLPICYEQTHEIVRHIATLARADLLCKHMVV